MSLNDSSLEIRTMQKKYTYAKTDALMTRIFTNLSSCEKNLQRMSFLDDIDLSSDTDSDNSQLNGGGHSEKDCIDKMLRAKTINELGILSTDTPPDMSSRQRVVFQRKKLKKYKNMYLGLTNVYNYIRNVAMYYYYLSLMSRKSNNALMIKLNGLNDMISEWSRKVGTDMSIANNKVENMEMMMNVLNKFLEKPVDVDLKVRGEVGDKLMKLDSRVGFGDVKFASSKTMQVGGSFTDEYEEAKEKIKQIVANNSFLNDKLTSLQSRMKKVISENENLFTIRAKVEFITNKLEECIRIKDDEGATQMIYDLNELMSMLRDYDSAQMVDVIKSLDSLVAYLEKTLKPDGTTDKTLKSINSADLTKLNDLMQGVIKSIGDKSTSQERPAQGGGRMNRRVTSQKGGEITNLTQEYEESTVRSIENLKKSLADHGQNSLFKLSNDVLERVSEYDEITVARLVTLSLNLKQIDALTQQLVRLLGAYADAPINWMFLWPIAFSHKTNTDFYTALLEKDVFNFTTKHGKQTLKDIILRGSLSDENRLGYELDDIDDEETLNVTYVALCTLFYVLARYAVCVSLLSEEDKSNLGLVSADAILRKMDKNLSKSLSHTFADHDHIYTAGNKVIPEDSIVKAKEQQGSIWMSDTEFETVINYIGTKYSDIANKIVLKQGEVTPSQVFFREFSEASTSALLRDPNVTLEGQMNGTVSSIKKKINDMLLDSKLMFNRVATMIGSDERYATVVRALEEASDPRLNLGTYEEILRLLSPGLLGQTGGSLGLELEKGFRRLYRTSYQAYIDLKRLDKYSYKTSSTKSQSGGSLVQIGGRKKLTPGTSPRVGAKRDQLKETFSKTMRPMAVIVHVLQKKLQSSDSLADPKEVNAFIRLYGEMKATIDKANNAFIRLLPMIFFAIEFPPELYMNNDPKSHYYITSNYPNITFTPYTQTKERGALVYPGYHQAFLNKTSNNSTNDLINDRLIGLETLTALTTSTAQPVNKVSNLMFAVGASGTGKTTRYFGYRGTGGKKDDRVGIMEYIINKNIAKSKIEVAYFVCYGREKQNNPSESMYDETLLFIKKDNDKFMLHPYTMSIADEDKVLGNAKIGFTEFYVRLMMRYLCAMEPQTFEDYASNNPGNQVKCKQPIATKLTFRDVLEKGGHDDSTNFWLDVSNYTQDKLKDLFQELIIEQKRLRTIMPTINNIESSRGHTCMVLKFTDKKTGGTSYFPLFDMAGTENIDGINSFYDELSNEADIKDGPENMRRLVETLLTVEKQSPDAEVRYVVGKKSLVSLKEIREMFINKLKEISPSGAPRGSPRQPGAVKEDYVAAKGKIEEIDVQKFLDSISSLNDLVKKEDIHLVDKVRDEGAYISHTIAMIIFAVLCVGETQRAIADDQGNDTFDIILDSVKEKMKQSTLCNAALRKSGTDKSCGPTMYLYPEDINYHHILNNSCIWAQIIFGLLYWNNETQGSTLEYFKTYVSDTHTHKNEINKYSIDAEDPGYLYNFDRNVSLTTEGGRLSINDMAEVDFNTVAQFRNMMTSGGLRLYNPNNIKSETKDGLFIALPDDTLYKLPESGDVTEIKDQTKEDILKKFPVSTIDKIKRGVVDTVRGLFNIKNKAQFNDEVKRIIGLNDSDIHTFVFYKGGRKGGDFKGVSGVDVVEKVSKTFCEEHCYYFITVSDHRQLSQKFSEVKLNFNVNEQDYNKMKNYLIEHVDNMDASWKSISDSELLAIKQKITQMFKSSKQDKQMNFMQTLFRYAADTVILKQKENINPQHKTAIVKDLNGYSERARKFIIKNVSEVKSEMPIRDEYTFLIELFKKYFTGTDEVQKKIDEYRSQIERVRDPMRNFYPPMAILMHCITGQVEKFEMVNSTLEMSKTLYEAVDVSEKVKQQ